MLSLGNNVLSIDPGVHKSACAIFIDGLLTFADDLKNDQAFQLIKNTKNVVVVVETPVLYPTKRKQHKDVARLLDIAKQMIKTSKTGVGVTPSAWKGQVPKKIHNKRVLSMLSDEEKRRVVSLKNHNTVDAVGIGLWFLQRCGRGGVENLGDLNPKQRQNNRQNDD